MRTVALPIWEPKYKDSTVLVSCLKVKDGENFIFFCMDKELTNLYCFNGKEAKENYDIVFNSKIYCYAVPLSKLKDCGELPENLIKLKARQVNKYRKDISR